jgi:hypothetical protein
MLQTAHPETGERLSAQNVRRQVITFLVAGHETTSGALSFALHYLSRHPDVAERARAEVDRVWGGTAVPGYDQVARLRYVRRILDESLRLWPTAPAFAREAREDTVPSGSIRIASIRRPYGRVRRTPSSRSGRGRGPASGVSSRCTRPRWCWGCYCAGTSSGATRPIGCG